MKKNLKEYIIVFIFIFGIIYLIPNLRLLILSLFEIDIKVENNNYQYKISYYESGNYDILLYKKYVKVLKKDQWMCVTDPCPGPYVVKWYRILITEEDRVVLEKLSNEYVGEVIYNKYLTSEEQNIINKVLEKAKQQ